MENFPPADKFDLPPGFRFHPTDEELITHYLSPKVLDTSFSAKAIGEVDLNKCEPWELPWMAKMGEKEWYFFCVRDRKYPTGLRTNRATDAGYWKATGKDKEIFKDKALIGMKKTLVFYKGRAPKGEKTNWVMHEYRLDGKLPHSNDFPSKNEWVICRVFHKSSGGKKMQISSSSSSQLPPLMEASPDQTEFGESSHVTCFSDPNIRDDTVDSLVAPFLASSTCSHQLSPPLMVGNSQFPNSYVGAEQLNLMMVEKNDGDISSVLYNNNGMIHQNEEYSSAYVGPVDMGVCLWNYSS